MHGMVEYALYRLHQYEARNIKKEPYYVTRSHITHSAHNTLNTNQKYELDPAHMDAVSDVVWLWVGAC